MRRFTRSITGISALLLVLLLSACQPIQPVTGASVQAAGQEMQQDVDNEPTILRADSVIRTHPSQGEVRIVKGASATVFLTREGALARLDTSELEPGHVYTLWWVVINNPAACAETTCTPSEVIGESDELQSDIGQADRIIPEDDTGHFAAFLPVGSLPDAWFGNGFTNPLDAHVHLVINHHGPLIPEMTATMLNSYRGGCTDESLPEVFPETAKQDGEPGPNSCALLQVAVLEP